MNFGEILDEWEKITSIPQGKKQRQKKRLRETQIPKKKNEKKPVQKINPITLWLETHSVYDKDAEIQYERQNSKKTKETLKSKGHSVTKWLENYEVYNKDAENQSEKLAPQEKRRRIICKKANKIIDLHRLTQEEAWNVLEACFQESKEYGFKKLLIIHGKGNHSQGEAVLKELVRRYIEHCPFAGESGYASSKNGGTGATWVLIK